MARKITPGINFLERHQQMERRYGIDDNHVIVDKKDWENTIELLRDIFLEKHPNPTIVDILVNGKKVETIGFNYSNKKDDRFIETHEQFLEQARFNGGIFSKEGKESVIPKLKREELVQLCLQNYENENYRVPSDLRFDEMGEYIYKSRFVEIIQNASFIKPEEINTYGMLENFSDNMAFVSIMLDFQLPTIIEKETNCRIGVKRSFIFGFLSDFKPKLLAELTNAILYADRTLRRAIINRFFAKHYLDKTSVRVDLKQIETIDLVKQIISIKNNKKEDE